MKKLGATKVASVSYSLGSSEIAARIFQKYAVPAVGLQDVYTNTSLDLGATDVSAAVLGIKNAGADAVYLPMASVSGTFFSQNGYPHFLKVIADVLPLTYFTRLSRDVMLHGHEVWSRPGPVLWVAAWGIAGLVVAIRRFRWEPREA